VAFAPTNLVSLVAFAPALDLERPGVLPWVVKLAPVGVERWSVIYFYFAGKARENVATAS